MKKSLLLAAVAAFVAVATVSAFAEYKVDGKVMGKVKNGSSQWANGDTGIDLGFTSNPDQGYKDFTIGYRLQDSDSIIYSNYVGTATNAAVLGSLTSPGKFTFGMDRKGAGTFDVGVAVIPFVYSAGKVNAVPFWTNGKTTTGNGIDVQPYFVMRLMDTLTVGTRNFADDGNSIVYKGEGITVNDGVNNVSASYTLINVGGKASLDLTSTGLPLTANVLGAYKSENRTSKYAASTTNNNTWDVVSTKFTVDGAYKLAFTPEFYVKPSAYFKLVGDPNGTNAQDITLAGAASTTNMMNESYGGLTTTIGGSIEFGYVPAASASITAALGVEMVTKTPNNVKSLSTNNVSNTTTSSESSLGWTGNFITFGGSATGGEFTVAITGKTRVSYTVSDSTTTQVTNALADKGPETTKTDVNGASFNNKATGDDSGTFTLAYKSAEEENWIFKGNYFNLTLLSSSKMTSFTSDDATGTFVTHAGVKEYQPNTAGTNGGGLSVTEIGKQIGDFKIFAVAYKQDFAKILSFTSGNLDIGLNYASGPVTVSFQMLSEKGLAPLNIFSIIGTGTTVQPTFGDGLTGYSVSASYAF